MVEEILERTPPELTLVVTATIPKGSRKAFYRKMKQGAVALEWAAPRDAEIPGWLMERAAEKFGITLDPRAAEALASAVGADLGLLEAELEKLAATGDGETVGIERIAEIVPNIRPVDRWGWLDSVASRDYRTALSDLPCCCRRPIPAPWD